MNYVGDFLASSVVRIMWDTKASTGASITRAVNGTIKIYKDNSTTERTSSSGITDTEDFDSNTGVHHLNIDTSDNADAGFYAAGHDYFAVLTGATIDGQTVNENIGSFSIENRNIKANLTQIDGLATSGNNATLYLKALNITNSANTAVTITSGGAGYVGVDIEGGGNGTGLRVRGGSGNSSGFECIGYGTGSGMVSYCDVGTGHGINAYGGDGGGNGIKVESGIRINHNSDTGVAITGGGVGNSGVDITGSGSGTGMRLLGGGNGSGLECIGLGTGSGISAFCDVGTGPGITAHGGDNGGNGVDITNGLTIDSEIPVVNLSSAGLDDVAVESGVNARQALSVIASVLSGVLSGASGTSITIKAINNSGTTRVTATVDANGNRSEVNLNLPA